MKVGASMHTYIVFDVETPNRYNNRMSAIGITKISDGANEKDFIRTYRLT